MNLNLAAQIARATGKSGICGMSHRDEALRDGREERSRTMCAMLAIEREGPLDVRFGLLRCTVKHR
jgi:hypothetical protein